MVKTSKTLTLYQYMENGEVGYELHFTWSVANGLLIQVVEDGFYSYSFEDINAESMNEIVQFIEWCEKEEDKKNDS